MHYSSSLEHIVNSYSSNSYSNISYFSKNVDGNYSFNNIDAVTLEPKYAKNTPLQYKNQQKYILHYSPIHSFTPEIFLSPSRPKTRFIDDSIEARKIAEEIFELMMNRKLPQDILIKILPFDDFKLLHSRFGLWNNGILGFSINGKDKRVFVRENNLDALMLVTGHEIGHVLTEALPNKHDEEAKAFAFSIEWAKTIKKHNVANLGLSINDESGFQPAKNDLHDIAFAFVDFMVKKGRKALEVHNSLAKQYLSMFNKCYYSPPTK